MICSTSKATYLVQDTGMRFLNSSKQKELSLFKREGSLMDAGLCREMRRKRRRSCPERWYYSVRCKRYPICCMEAWAHKGQVLLRTILQAAKRERIVVYNHIKGF